MNTQTHIKTQFNQVRKHSVDLCEPLNIEDYSVQATEFVSPPKWHLAHSTWFWEAFVLSKYFPDYEIFNPNFSYLFNSYYNHVGDRVLRPMRGLMTRPSVAEVLEYRNHINAHMNTLLESKLNEDLLNLIEIGLQHEEQHQELLIYDIKYILGHQVGFPKYNSEFVPKKLILNQLYIHIEEGLYEIGHQGNGFCFDNELGRHKVYLEAFEIAREPVSNEDYLEFINAGGYNNFEYWHDEGWQWVLKNQISSPLYWHQINGNWHEYDLNGLEKLNLKQAVKHISFYEASAFAEWKRQRLPTEAEWEIAANQLNIGHNWEWTQSAYLPYPRYQKASGALGEYNGKFMINQMVLKGASTVTPPNHSRITYRNFFHPNMRWQYAGLRLVKKTKNHESI
jgi:ergothioneine biosynthesis protein EgtB